MVEIENLLEHRLRENTLPTTLLFVGKGGELLAYKLAARRLGCEKARIDSHLHPDFQRFSPEGKSGVHTIDSIRLLTERVYQSPFEASCKVFVLCHAERMQTAAANALLKTLEEPLLDTTLILLADDDRTLLATILSRCTRFVLSQEQKVWAFDFSHLPTEFARIEKELDETEDPVLKAEKLEGLCMSFLMWARDQEVRLCGVSEDFLFFPKAPPCKKSVKEYSFIIEECRLGIQRNLPLRAILAHLQSGI